MFGRNKDKVVVRLTGFEIRVIVKAMVELRNWLIQNDKPTEDVDEVLLKFCK